MPEGNTMLKFFVRTALICALLLVNDGCRNRDDRVPVVFVDFTLLLDLPEFSDLASPGGSIHISGGSMGIIIYRRSQDEFVAFDRHCTYQVPEYCRVTIDEETTITANCECCNSVFSIYDGTPISGEAAVSLSRYGTGYNGTTNQLRIFNF